MQKLDALDRKILFELDRNSRRSISEIAKTLKQGRDRVEYRMDRLIQKKIIRKCFASINVYRLGFRLYKTYIRLENNKSKVAEYLAYLQKHPRLYWIALCDGGWDLVVVFMARSSHEFHEIHTKVLSEFNEVVLNFAAYSVVTFKSYARGYLYKGHGAYEELGGEPGALSIDKIDFQILRILSVDARMPAVAIGDRVGLTHQAVLQRIARMEKLEIISGYRVELDLSAIGMLFIKTQFFLRNYEISLREKFKAYCEKHPNIIWYIEQIGDCNIEIELEVQDYEQYSEIIDEIRGEYSKLVRNFQTMLIRKSTRYSIPQELPNLAPAVGQN